MDDINPALVFANAIKAAKDAGGKDRTASCISIWAKALSVAPEDPVLLYRMLSYVAVLPTQIRTLIAESGRTDLEFIDEQLARVNDIFSIAHMYEPWQNVGSRLDDPLMVALHAASAIFAERRQISAAARDNSDHLIDAISNLLAEVRAADAIDPPLADFLIRSLTDIEVVLRRYAILGSKVLRDLSDQTVGGIVRLCAERPERMKNDKLKKLTSILSTLALVVGLGNQTYQLENNISGLIAHQSTVKTTGGSPASTSP